MVDNDIFDLYENVVMCDFFGFCDLCFGEDKYLCVCYCYRRVFYEVIVKADAMVSFSSVDYCFFEKF